MMTVRRQTRTEAGKNFYFLRELVFYGDESARSLVVEGTQETPPYVRL
jgi:hypothetical protein